MNKLYSFIEKFTTPTTSAISQPNTTTSISLKDPDINTKKKTNSDETDWKVYVIVGVLLFIVLGIPAIITLVKMYYRHKSSLKPISGGIVNSGIVNATNI
jgi:hypothetical protein